MKNLELLAPAGNLEKLKTAFLFGADAVYCGLPEFSLRTRINQFNLAKLRQGIEYAHLQNKKVYVTVNILAHNKHIEKLIKFLLKLKQINPDALIISDPGILKVIKKVWPKAEIHLSTQANCTNWQSAKFWYDLGVKRIVLGREVTLKEIKQIHAKVPKVELEYFVHGAMCMSYSGRCLLSQFFTNRSANLGDCTQPCRWEYKTYIKEVQRPDELLQVEQDEHGSYIMNSKDLCLIKYLKQLKNAGICSFKIEGRAKSIYYVGAVTRIYKQAIVEINKKINFKSYLNELEKIQNRGYTSGFLFNKENCEQNIEQSHKKCFWEFCGVVVDYKKDKGLKIKVHNQIFENDEIEFLVPFNKTVKYKVKKIYNDNGEQISEAHGGQKIEVWLADCAKLSVGSLVRRKIKASSL